jgi:putative sigma-54 modulation protein
MHITITARHMEMTEALRDYAEQKVKRITKYLDNIIEAQVILSVEKYRHIAEVTIKANGININGEEQTADMYSSIDKVMDKIERQLRKHKGRAGSRKQRTDKKQQVPEEFFAPEIYAQNPIESSDIVDASSAAFADKIIKTEGFALKPMSIEEAAMQVSLSDDNFLLFRNSGNEQVNLIYRRKDGNFGLIET